MKKIFFILIIILLKNNIYAMEENNIVIAAHSRPPFFIYEKNTNAPYDGDLYNLVVKIFTEAKIPYEFREMPLLRSFQQIKMNQIKICSPFAFKNKDRVSYSLFSKSYFQDKQMVVLYKKNSDKFKNINTLKELILNHNFKILVKVGYSYGVYFDDLMRKHKNFDNSVFKASPASNIVLTSADNTEMFYNIIHDKADYLLVGRNEGEYLLKMNPDFNLNLEIKDLEDVPSGEKRYLMCSYKVGNDIIAKINKQIDQLKN